LDFGVDKKVQPKLSDQIFINNKSYPLVDVKLEKCGPIFKKYQSWPQIGLKTAKWAAKKSHFQFSDPSLLKLPNTYKK